MGWLGRSIGAFGSQAGEGHDIALDWRAREQDMRMKAAKQKLDELLLPLQIQEIQARLRQMGMPKTERVGLPGGGTGVFSISPTGEPSDVKTLVPGEEPPLKQRYESEKDPEKKKKLLQELGEESQATSKRSPMQEAQEALMTALASGNPEAIGAARKNLEQLASSSKAPPAPSQWNLRVKAITDQGPEGDVARAALKAQEDEQMKLVKARGLAFGQGRLFALGDYIMGDGSIRPMTGFEALAARDRGEKITPTGKVNTNIVIGFQRLQSEAGPALKDVQDNLGTFDNASDRAIFARVLGGAGQPSYGSEASWLKNILDQVATDELSPEGQRFKASAARLADTMGLARASMALPATDAAMNLTMSLLPGKSTPSKAYAEMQVDKLRGIIVNTGNIPIFGNMPNTLATPTPPNMPPPPGFTNRVNQ
jgi:hypothetical protein